MNNTTFPGFGHQAEALSAYIFSIDLFIISLRTGNIVHFTADDNNAFRSWLDSNGIRDITNGSTSEAVQ